MPINSSGPIALGSGSIGQSINLELGKAIDAQISMNDSDARALAQKSGVNQQISMSDFYGKPVTPSVTPPVSITPSRTPAISISLTPAPSISKTPFPSETPSPTPAVSITATPSLTPPISPSQTPTITPTPTRIPCYEYTATASQSDLDSSDNGTVYFDYIDCAGNPQTLQRGTTDTSFPVCARSVGSIYIYVFGSPSTAFGSFWSGAGPECF